MSARIGKRLGIGTLLLLAACSTIRDAGRTAEKPASEPSLERAALAAAAAAEPAAGAETLLAGSTSPTDCRRLLSAVLAGEGGAMLPVVLLGGDDAVRLDLPGLKPTAEDTPAPCLLLVDRVVAEGGTVVETARETIASRRRTGSQRRVNPAYTRLERELAAARREQRRSRSTRSILATGDPSLDLLGMVAETLLAGGRALFGGEDRVAELERQLAETEPFIDAPIYRRYRYRLLRYAGRRTGAVRVALLDAGRRRGWTTRVSLEETRRFALAEGRDPEDDTPLPEDVGELAERADLEAWREGPPKAPASVLLRHLEVAMRAPARSLTRQELLAAWRAAAPIIANADPSAAASRPASTPRESESVVVLRRGEAAAGLGFYVTPEMILTLERFLGKSVLVPVEVAPELVTYGIVEARDAESGLVLVWVPKSGPPLALAEGPVAGGAPWLPKVASGKALRAGAPLVKDGRVVGLLREDGGASAIPARTLRRFLERFRDEGRRTAASRQPPAAASRG